MSKEEPNKGRRPKPRHAQVILGAIEENAMMLIRDPHSEGIGMRISDLLAELHRALNSGKESEDE